MTKTACVCVRACNHAGVAYLHFHLATTLHANDDAKRALHLRRSLQILKPSLERLRRKPEDCSFLLGVAGPLALGAVVHHYLKNAEESRGCTEKLKGLYLEHRSVFRQLPSELLYGHVGYLYSLLFVNCHVPTAIDEALLTEVGMASPSPSPTLLFHTMY